MLLTSLSFLIVFISFVAKNSQKISDFSQEAHNQLFYLYKHINRIAIIVILYVLYLTINIFSLENINSGISIYNNLFKITSLSTIISILILLIVGLLLFLNSVNIIGYNFIDSIHYSYKEYILLILFNLLGLLLFPAVNDIISLFVIIELQSYSLYLITSIYRESNNATKAGLMYFLLGGLASILILLGSAILYYVTGMTSLDYIFTLVNYTNYLDSLYFGFLFIVLGLLWKMGLAPFHNWSITVYSNTPTIVTSYISLMAKLSILPFMYTIINSLNIENNYINYIIGISVLLSMLIGSLGGLSQIKIKVLLAYSGVINAGYLLLSLLVNTQEGLVGFIVYIYQYGLTHVNIFFVVLLASYYIVFNSNLIKSNSNNSILLSSLSPIEYINQLNGLLIKNSYLAMALIISLFSLIGIPPLLGFYGKFYILISSLNKGYLLLSLGLILFSVVTTVYYAYIIKTLSFSNIKLTSTKGNNLSSSICYIISTITLIILLNICQIDTILQGAYILAFNNLLI